MASAPGLPEPVVGRHNFRITALIIASALFMEQLDSTVLATALPTMARSFHVSPLHMSAALTSYMLGLALFIPASGYFADRFGARRIFRLAIVIFTLGSILCGQSGSLPFLVAARSGLITFSTAAGSFLMKMVTAPILRRFGFRATLMWNSLIATGFLAICAAFRPSWPVLAIHAVLLVGGFFQSLQFTALNTIAYADIPQARMSAATSFYSTFQQMTLSVGICVSSGVLALSIGISRHGTPRLSDFSVAFLVVTAISFLASPVLSRLPVGAGAAMSGHGDAREGIDRQP